MWISKHKEDWFGAQKSRSHPAFIDLVGLRHAGAIPATLSCKTFSRSTTNHSKHSLGMVWEGDLIECFSLAVTYFIIARRVLSVQQAYLQAKRIPSTDEHPLLVLSNATKARSAFAPMQRWRDVNYACAQRRNDMNVVQHSVHFTGLYHPGAYPALESSSTSHPKILSQARAWYSLRG